MHYLGIYIDDIRLVTIIMASKQLHELMEFRKLEGIRKLMEIGGLHELIDALNTSEKIGKRSHRDHSAKSCISEY